MTTTQIPAYINGARVIVRRSPKRRKTIALALKQDGSIILSAPAAAPQKFLESFFVSRLSWIKEKIEHFQSRTGDLPPKNASPAFIDHCRKQARFCLEEKTAHYGRLMGLEPNKIRINNAKTRWGSCSARNNLNFPWRISLLPPAIIDYIVVHELAHIKEKNHGPGFWKTVADTIPDFKNSRTWLRKNSHLYPCR